LDHSTLVSRVIKKKREEDLGGVVEEAGVARLVRLHQDRLAVIVLHVRVCVEC